MAFRRKRNVGNLEKKEEGGGIAIITLSAKKKEAKRAVLRFVNILF